MPCYNSFIQRVLPSISCVPDTLRQILCGAEATCSECSAKVKFCPAGCVLSTVGNIRRVLGPEQPGSPGPENFLQEQETFPTGLSK